MSFYLAQVFALTTGGINFACFPDFNNSSIGLSIGSPFSNLLLRQKEGLAVPISLLIPFM